MKAKLCSVCLCIALLSLATGNPSLGASAVRAPVPAPVPAEDAPQQVSGNPPNGAPADGAPASETPAGSAQKPTVLSSDLVSLTVSVTDSHGKSVTGLTRDHFEIYDDKVRQQIAHFSSEDVPISLGIIYDVSGSMQGKIDRSLAALKRMMETSHEDDDLFLLTFNDRVRLAHDFTTSADELIGSLALVRPSGSTALYDAVYLGVEKARQARHSKKALLVITDGEDNRSRYNFKELRAAVSEADVMIYAIGISDPIKDRLAVFGREVLSAIAGATGGRAFFPSDADESELMEICTRIALELRHQYSVGFYPSDVSSPSRWHKLQLRLNPPKGVGRLSVSYRQGYRSTSRLSQNQPEAGKPEAGKK